MAVILAGCTNTVPQPPLRLAVGVDGSGKCTLSLDGRVLNSNMLIQILKKRGTREIHLMGWNPWVPFRCVGPVIEMIQRAKMPLKVAIISEPPPGNANLSEH